ncbi:hypothetical protein BD289DRAFT_191656 [Coniella lustricola]|uniref:Uncharacterized protein n=1 Tax=Coniella lustricola TaxID=2025994 RepID=A0A2T3AM05_9PEZI|nr:hypothetical protein BD289DRAFT_191656 [Coniella lustricola]
MRTGPMRICSPAGVCYLQWVSLEYGSSDSNTSNGTHTSSVVPQYSMQPKTKTTTMSTTTPVIPGSTSVLNLPLPGYQPGTFTAITTLTTSSTGVGGSATSSSCVGDQTTTTSISALNLFFIAGGAAIVVLGALGFLFQKKVKRCVNRSLDSCLSCWDRCRKSNNKSPNKNNKNGSSSGRYDGDIELRNLVPGHDTFAGIYTDGRGYMAPVACASAREGQANLSALTPTPTPTPGPMPRAERPLARWPFTHEPIGDFGQRRGAVEDVFVLGDDLDEESGDGEGGEQQQQQQQQQQEGKGKGKENGLQVESADEVPSAKAVEPSSAL